MVNDLKWTYHVFVLCGNPKGKIFKAILILNRNNTYSMINLYVFSFPRDRTKSIEESGLCTPIWHQKIWPLKPFDSQNKPYLIVPLLLRHPVYQLKYRWTQLAHFCVHIFFIRKRTEELNIYYDFCNVHNIQYSLSIKCTYNTQNNPFKIKRCLFWGTLTRNLFKMSSNQMGCKVNY